MFKTVTLGEDEFHVEIRGEGPPLLLVHGFPLDHHMWDDLANLLASDFRLIIPDLRGFGQTTGFREESAMSQMAVDLERLLEGLEIREAVTFCGLSMGGYVGWQFWKNHRSHIERLILMDTKAVADSDEQKKVRHETAQMVLAEGMHALPEKMIPKLLAEQTIAARPEVVKALSEMMLRQRPQGVAAALRGMAHRPDVTPWLADIDLPVLVICGEHDAISPPEEMAEIANNIPAANYAEIPGTGHMTPMEAPDLVAQAIREFFEPAEEEV